MSEIAYFDNAATTFPKPEKVYAFVDKFYRECGVNVGRGQYRLASKASSLVSDTRELLLGLNHSHNKSVIFNNTATEALNIILRGFSWRDGMTVYISPFEHNAVTRVLQFLNKSFRLNIEMLDFDCKRLVYNLDGIKEQFEKKIPNMVVISHASNVCGIVAPIEEIFTLAKQFDATTVIDMCQTMGLINTDLSSDIYDYAVFAGHKTLYSPFGVGGFICSASANVAPLIIGGTGMDSASQELPDTIPERYEVGSSNIMAIAGLNASLRWIKEISMATIRNKEHENRGRLVELLNRYDNIQIVASSSLNETVGVVSCVFDGYASDNIGQILSEKNVAVRTGLHCAPTAHKSLGTFPTGTVRFSVGYFNDDRDFEVLEEVLSYIHKNS